MPEARPFVGLVYDPAAGPLETLTTPPYDVIAPREQDRFYRANPHNIIRLILSRDVPDEAASTRKKSSGQGPAGRYAMAASTLRSWRAEGVLRPTPQPSVYPYEFEFHLGGSRRRLRGLIIEVELEPWGRSILPHERTLPGPIEDRLSLLRSVAANLSPVYALLFGGDRSGRLSAFLDSTTRSPPALGLTDEEGTRHRLWIAPAPAEEATDAIRAGRMMIADGHHRYAVALVHRDEMRALHGPGPWDSMMMLVIDAEAEDPPVLPIHRLVTAGTPSTPQGELVPDLAEVLLTVSDDLIIVGTAEKVEGKLIHRVASLAGQPPAVCALHAQALDTAPGIELRFLPDAAQAEEAVRSGQGLTAFFLPPTRVDRVWNLVAAGGTLPQKSTYFWPKPRTGLVIRPFHV